MSVSGEDYQNTSQATPEACLPEQARYHLERLGNLADGNPAAQISVGAIKEMLLERTYQATRDPLTGVLNRRGFFETAGGVIALHRPVILSTIDLNKFKVLNNEHGHAVGDAALLGVATGLMAASPDGLVSRFGGDEFVVLDNFPTHSNPDQAAQEVGNNMRRHVEAAIEVSLPDLASLVSFSVGHSVRPELQSLDDIDEMLKESDSKMYREKRND